LSRKLERLWNMFHGLLLIHGIACSACMFTIRTIHAFSIIIGIIILINGKTAAVRHLGGIPLLGGAITGISVGRYGGGIAILVILSLIG